MLRGASLGLPARYASERLVTKNNVATTAVDLDRNVADPRAPKTVPEAPEPKPAPASAPLPRCSSTRATIAMHRKTCMPLSRLCSMVVRIRRGAD